MPCIDLNAPAKQAMLAAAAGALLGLGFVAPLMAQQGARVTIANFAFTPGSVSVAKGAPITFVNNDGAAHSVVIASKSLRTATLQKGQSGRLSIKDPGTYRYVCGIHPSMTGSIEVK